MEREEIVAALLRAAGGRLVGRVRLQKVTFLLDKLGLNSGFRYNYGNYGPFSHDLDNAVADAEAFGLVEETFDRRQIDGARYSIFELTDDASRSPTNTGQLNETVLDCHLKTFAEADVTVLELAAMANWLAEDEKLTDWRDELRRRKGPKVRGGRLDRALALLHEAGLPPANADARA